MRLTQLFTKTRRDAPKDETAKNAQLLIRAGYIYKDAAGVYGFLPLGLKVLNNIIGVVRDEMNALGGQEVTMTTLQRRELWEQTDRWDDELVDVWFKTKLKNDTEVGLGWSHEEQMTVMMREFIASYRDLPRMVYQFQTKLRNETRAKSGIMRTREFIMKDAYSFSRSQEEHDKFYDRVTDSYRRIFDRLGIGKWTYLTYASGGPFAKYSHEFQTLSEAGEDTIYIDEKKQIAINDEVMTPAVLKELDVKEHDLKEAKASEVGNIFNLGTTKSEPFDLKFVDEAGQPQLVVMGSYGIGPARVMGVIVERLADDRGLVWPDAIAPFAVHLVRLGAEAEITTAADKLYDELTAAGVEVLYDDRDESAGAKFADADLMGVPLRLTVSKKTLAEESAEWKRRDSEETKLVKLDSLVGLVQKGHKVRH